MGKGQEPTDRQAGKERARSRVDIGDNVMRAGRRLSCFMALKTTIARGSRGKGDADPIL